MGPGGSLFDGFGHAALRLREPARGRDRVFTFGALSWTGPLLGWRFLRGEVLFEIRVRSFRRVLRSYRRQDRSVFRQPLDLSPAEVHALALRLEEYTLPENARFQYHHFRDNCSTRPRDLIDQVTGGAVRAALSEPGDGRTYRDGVLGGLNRNPALLLIMEVVLGRLTDRPLSRWELCFLPTALREELATVRRLRDGRMVLLAPQTITAYARKGPIPGWPIAAGEMLAWLLAAGVLAFCAVLVVQRRRRGTAGRRSVAAGLIAWAVVGGLLGLVLDTVATSDFVPEFQRNENLLVFTLLDLWLLLPAILRFRRSSPGLWRRLLLGYLGLRLLGAAAILMGQATGLLVQTPIALPFLGTVACGALLYGVWHAPTAAAPDRSAQT